MNLCPFKKWKDIFGEVDKGVHQYKIGGSAIVDYIMTIIGSILTTFIAKQIFNYDLPLTITTLFWLILGILLHILFGVETDTIKFLKLNC